MSETTTELTRAVTATALLLILILYIAAAAVELCCVAADETVTPAMRPASDYVYRHHAFDAAACYELTASFVNSNLHQLFTVYVVTNNRECKPLSTQADQC